MEPLVEVFVSRLGLDGSSNTYVVILREKDGDRILPIWIGQPEADAILWEMNEVKRERPLTHDLCKNIIIGLGAVVQRVEITRVEERTYFAELHLMRGEQRYKIDARPSDSIAIALRTRAPIFAADSLLIDPPDESEEEQGPESDAGELELPMPDTRPSGDQLTPEQLKQHLSSLRPEDFGKFNP